MASVRQFIGHSLRRGVVALAFGAIAREPIASQQPAITPPPSGAFVGRIIGGSDSTGVQSADIRLVFVDSARRVTSRRGEDSLEIFMDSTRVRVGVTDSVGNFAIRRMHSGPYILDVRRIGYEPLHGVVTVDTTELSTTLVMPVISRALAKVVITASSVDRVKQTLERQGFTARQRLGIAATFVDRADILRRRPQTLGDILSSQGITKGMITLDGMRIEYDFVRDYPADMVIGVEIYRHSRPTEFNAPRPPNESVLISGAAQPLVLVWTLITIR